MCRSWTGERSQPFFRIPKCRLDTESTPPPRCRSSKVVIINNHACKESGNLVLQGPITWNIHLTCGICKLLPEHHSKTIFQLFLLLNHYPLHLKIHSLALCCLTTIHSKLISYHAKFQVFNLCSPEVQLIEPQMLTLTDRHYKIQIWLGTTEKVAAGRKWCHQIKTAKTMWLL